jgi:hypothetical protein
MSQSEPEKKIIVDEDWKSRVEAERKAPDEAKPDTAPSADEEPQLQFAADDQQLPPPDLMFLAGTLYMQALLGLGLLPNPMTKKAEVRLNQAKHGIDALEVLQKKTEGNRTSEETAAIEGMLHELRMTFVEVLKRKPAKS